MHILSSAKLQISVIIYNGPFFFMHKSTTELVVASNPPSFTIVYSDFGRDEISLHLSAAKSRWCWAKALNLPNAAQLPHQFNWSFSERSVQPTRWTVFFIYFFLLSEAAAAVMAMVLLRMLLLRLCCCRATPPFQLFGFFRRNAMTKPQKETGSSND